MIYMDGMPAWMLCQDLLLRMKEACISEAIETLDNEVKNKRMKIEGDLVTAEEQSGALEKNLFIIKNITEHEGEMIDRYSNSIREMSSGEHINDPRIVERIEELKKAILAIVKIATLSRYSSLFEEWMDDVGYHTKEQKIEDVLSATLQHGSRAEALEFFVKNKKLSSGFTQEEIDALVKALNTSAQSGQIQAD